MSLTHVAQAQALASELERLQKSHHPASICILGCAGGNGLEKVDPIITKRVVAVDINPEYVDVAKKRFGKRYPTFQAIVQDIASGSSLACEPVDMVFAGLLLEYVPLRPALHVIRGIAKKGTVVGSVLQRPSKDLPEVSPSPYSSLEVLAHQMKLVEPKELVREAALFGLRFSDSHISVMPNGKELLMQVFRAE